MDEKPAPAPKDEKAPQPAIHSLRELIDIASGKNQPTAETQEDAGFAENLPFPFLALVGQTEMKLALLLSLINPAVGGVLLIGPRGTGKTTAIRSLHDLLPEVRRSTCYYGCLPEDIESGGMDAVCPDCARKYAEGVPLTRTDQVRLVELPLNAGLEDVIGGLDERAAVHDRMRLKRGLLAQADQNILFVDEVNLLANDIVNAILDAAAQGTYTVRRGPHAATYRARCNLIGSMNPEEGLLRPQIMDRFGLRVVVRGLTEPSQRMEAYQRVRAHRSAARQMIADYLPGTMQAREEIQAAQKMLPGVWLPEDVAAAGIDMVRRLQIDSLRAEISLFEAAKANAAADGRSSVSMQDLKITAPLALRLRRSAFMVKYFQECDVEEDELKRTISQAIPLQDKEE